MPRPKSAKKPSYDKLLTPADVADMFRLSPRSVGRAMVGAFAGRPALRPVLRTATVVRFRRSDVEAWLDTPPKTKGHRRGRPRKEQPIIGF
jgi:hypothetical protein